jgi:hypothetical protein
MKLGLSLLAALTLAFVSGEVAVLTLWRCNPDAAGGDLGCYIGGVSCSRGFMLAGFGARGVWSSRCLEVVAVSLP